MAKEAALAAKRCMQAQENGIVDLSGCRLMNIPQAFYMVLKQTPVTIVDLSDNDLKTVDSKIPKAFPNISELIFGKNKLVKLTEAVLQLEKLVHLDLADNQFTAVPLVPSSLKRLDLSNNLITCLTQEEIEKLLKIDEVLLSGNDLDDETKCRLENHENFTF